MNLIREFEFQKMKESETIKDYLDRLLSIVNKVRLLGFELNDSRIVEKILVTVLERYEATVITLENTKDLSKISMVELLNSLQTQEQRRLMRQNVITKGVYNQNIIELRRTRRKKRRARKKTMTLRPRATTKVEMEISKENIYPASTMGRKAILHLDVGEDPMPNIPNATSSDMRL